MSTKVDRIDAAKRRVLAARTFVFDLRRLVFVNAARAVIPIEDVEDHDLEWLERWIAEIESVCPDWKQRAWNAAAAPSFPTVSSSRIS